MAALPPLEREAGTRTLENGLVISERRIPIGTVGANFEARPNVALDVAAPAPEEPEHRRPAHRRRRPAHGARARRRRAAARARGRGAAGRRGRARALAGSRGRRCSSRCRRCSRSCILRGSGETTAQLARLAAENGVRALAHAEGGGVLYVDPAASREKTLAIAEASLDRLGVCNRLNLLLVDRGARELLPDLLALLERLGLEARGTERVGGGVLPLDVRLGHEWANDAARVSTVTIDVVDDLDEAVRIANDETSVSPRGS